MFAFLFLHSAFANWFAWVSHEHSARGLPNAQPRAQITHLI